MKPKVNLSTWQTGKEKKITAKQARESNCCRFHIYYQGKFLKSFNRSWNWPFIWNIGMCFGKRKQYRVTQIRYIYCDNICKIYWEKTPENYRLKLLKHIHNVGVDNWHGYSHHLGYENGATI